jgi:hypothetical protein
MDLKVYYRKIRIVEAEIADADVVMISLETPDGGRAGVATEVRRRLAAKLVVEGKARLASSPPRTESRWRLCPILNSGHTGRQGRRSSSHRHHGREGCYATI